MNKQDIKLLEANFLDGDTIDDCGGCTHSISGVMDIIDFFQERNNSKISKLLKEIVHSMVYDCSSGDDMIESLEEIINNSEFKELI